MKLEMPDALPIVIGFALALPVIFSRNFVTFLAAIVSLGTVGGLIEIYFSSDKTLMPIKGVFLDHKYRKKMLRMKGGRYYVYFTLFYTGFILGMVISAAVVYLPVFLA